MRRIQLWEGLIKEMRGPTFVAKRLLVMNTPRFTAGSFLL
jgi:hypothetical protein